MNPLTATGQRKLMGIASVSVALVIGVGMALTGAQRIADAVVLALLFGLMAFCVGVGWCSPRLVAIHRHHRPHDH